MAAVLLVGGWDEPAVAALSKRGYDLRLVPHDGVAEEHADVADCVVVRAGPADLAIVETFAGEPHGLPVVFATERRSSTAAEDDVDRTGEGDMDRSGEAGADRSGDDDAGHAAAGGAGTVAAALEYGADDHVHLGEGAGERLAARVERLTDDPAAAEPSPLRTDGDRSGMATAASAFRNAADGAGDGPEDSPFQSAGEFQPADPGGPDGGDGSGRSAERGRHEDDGRIRTLLESAGTLMDADREETIAETTVTAAEQVLGYDLVAVHLLDEAAATLEPAAVTERAESIVGDLDPWDVEAHPAGEALLGDGAVALDGDALTGGDDTSLSSAFVVPLGGHGTLSFATTGDAGFDDGDRRVAEQLAANATVALERISRLERLERLHHATQTMLDARSPPAVAERAVEAAESILGYEFVRFHLHDEEDEALEPVAWTDALQGAIGIPDAIDAGGAGPWEAFEENRVIRYDRIEDESLPGSTRFESQLHVPVGDHGLLVIEAFDPDVFDGTDVQLARLLATNSARTLDRVERTQELETYESVFESVSDMVFVLDKRGFVTHCTPALARRLGFRRADLLGKHVSQLVEDDALQDIASISDRLVDEPSSAARTQRVDLQTQYGDEIPVQIDVSLLPGEGYNGVVGTIREISDLLAVQERLDSQQARFEYLFENIPDPVVETNHEDGQATAVSVNPAFVETFGFTADELRDRPLNEVIVPKELRQQAELLDEKLAEGEVHQTEIERETQYGVREFLFRGVPYTASDGTTRAFAIYTDITEQRERERHLDVLQRILRHNVRNDVNVLLGGLEKFEKDGLDGSTLGTLQDSADDLLEMSKKAKRISHVLEADREQLDTIDLTTLTRDVIEQYRSSATDAEIRADLPPSCPVVGSRTIARAIEELVGNAVQHAGEAPTVDVTITVEGQRASVTVADDGPGIPEQERLVLQEDEITPVQHGSGLGLWLVKHATTASGGTISFDEPADGGSVTLSFRRADD